MYDVRSPVSIGEVLLAYLACVVMFACIGVMLGAVIPSARAAQGVGLSLFFVMMFLAGTAPPRKLLGGVLERVGATLSRSRTPRWPCRIRGTDSERTRPSWASWQHSPWQPR